MAERLSDGAPVRYLPRALADVFLPRLCIFCGAPVSSAAGADFCRDCAAEAALPEGRYCKRCAVPMATYAAKCPNCHNLRIRLDRATAFGFHSGVLRERVLEYKFNGDQYLARTLGALVARAAEDRWPEVAFDAVAGVPLHRRRKRERGFDQGRELGRWAARRLGAPWAPGLLRRVRYTESQVGLTRTARLKNVKGAFAAFVKSKLENVLLVDDTMTTGATLSEAARALKRAGVIRVYAAVAARAGFDAGVPVAADAAGNKGTGQ